MDPSRKHDWALAAITFVVTVIVNLVIFSYGQGKLDHRIETLETKMETLHKDWQLARDRIERALRDVSGRPQHEQFISPIQPR